MTKPPRSALPLPRYVDRKPLRTGWGYFFHVPSQWKKAGYPVKDAPLGNKYGAAVRRAETILLPALDAWRTGGSGPALSPATATYLTLDWVFGEYRADRKFTKLDPKTRRNREAAFRLVGCYVLKDGKRLGEKYLRVIDTAFIDDLYKAAGRPDHRFPGQGRTRRASHHS